MVLNGEATRLFVHNFMGRSVSVFDVRDLITARGNAAPLLAEVATIVAEKRLTPQGVVGKRIFYNAADPRMSRDKYMSCASCHLDGDQDGQVWDFTQVGEGFRNTISLLGKAGMGHGRLHWTANFDEIQDFENDIRHFAGGTGFMSDEDFAATSDPLGPAKAGLSAELDALAAFLTSFDRVPDSPYRSPDGSLTATGVSGRMVFVDQGCAVCHAGTNFTDGRRSDVGTLQPHSGAGHGQPLPGVGFDTPTLRGVWATAPYLHDGSAATLREVLDNPHHVGRLGEPQKSMLVEYLLQVDEARRH
jgi:cytochrome c peroxidase